MSILACFFLALIPYAASITFNFPNIRLLRLPFNRLYVAVEFDTFGGNEWDPRYPGTNVTIDDHVGININSVTSVAYRKWYSNITYGKHCRALINYYANSKNLSVSFTSFQNNLPVWETGLNYTIDLRTVLPEWVIFGFSASTGVRYQKNSVRSWTFNSTKVDKINGLAPIKGKNNASRKVGLIAGTLVLVTVLGILAYFLWRRKKNNGDKVEEHGLAKGVFQLFKNGVVKSDVTENLCALPSTYVCNLSTFFTLDVRKKDLERMASINDLVKTIKHKA
ncbi:hypothetical protein L1987_55184 [Smallanthus sonchifolius]|uniref:Uncharacterized protein n=1 Tax=Smallanthus sonchifolius TaxID=185202 RepID=A0ACB9E984_9ASTR|nr:hypothetical protein L1987_55184 [Smallanthus sonchifolius]